MACGLVLGTVLVAPLEARVLDRVVASVGGKAITASDIETEYRFERFLEGRVPSGRPTAKLRSILLKRLISRRLLEDDMKSSGSQPKPSVESARQALAQIRKRFSSPRQYASALRALGMSEEEVLKRLEVYQDVLRYIDRRFQPVSPPTEAEIRAYYESVFTPEFEKVHHRPPPPQTRVESVIREILVQKELDQRLTEWLKEMNSTEQVRIM